MTLFKRVTGHKIYDDRIRLEDGFKALIDISHPSRHLVTPSHSRGTGLGLTERWVLSCLGRVV